MIIDLFYADCGCRSDVQAASVSTHRNDWEHLRVSDIAQASRLISEN